MHVLIDTTGKVWDERSGGLRIKFNASITSRALPDYLIRNMGYIGLRVMGDSIAVRAAPALASYAAFSMLVELVEANPVRRSALRWFDGGWNDETFFQDSGSSAKKRLLQLMLSHRRNRGLNYLSYPRELATIAPNHPHARLLAYWRDVGGKFDARTNQATLYQLTDGKFLTIERLDNGKLAFSSIGKGLTVYRDNSWATQFSGSAVEDQPDYNYGQWIEKGYREAFAKREPIVCDYDAVVNDARNGNSQHHRYTRLLLPIETQDGLELLSAPRADSTIDLTLEVR